MEALKKIFNGFLYGLGFSTALFLFTFVASKIAKQPNTIELSNQVTIPQDKTILPFEPNLENNEIQKLLEKGDFGILYSVDESFKLHILSSKAINNGFSIDIVGSLKNDSANTYDSVMLKAQLFDKQGTFIYQCESRVSEDVPPGSSVNFMVDCRPINKELSEAFSTFTLKVTHASYKKNN